MKRIFLGTVEIAGVLTNLEKGLIENGFDVEILTRQEHKFKYSEKKTNVFQKLIFKLTKLIENNHNNFVRKIFVAAREFVLILIFPYYLFRCNTFIFLAGESILYSNIDLPILRFFRKNIIVEFLGSDSRPTYVNGGFENHAIEDLIRINKRIKRRISFIEKYATHIVCWPSTAMFFSKQLINGFYIGVPVNIPSDNSNINKEKNKIKILHCPSKLKGKGTYIFRKIIDELKLEGYEFEYKELHNVANSIVKEELKTANFVLDQCFSDVPLAVFASEAASYKCPAIVGGYNCKDRYNYFCNELNIPPTDYISPQKIKDEIRFYLDNPSYVLKKGEELYNFVIEHYDYKIITDKMIRIIKNDIPKEWLYSPYDVEYPFGFGLSIIEIQKICKKIISSYGNSALLLDDKPKLKNKILDLCNGKFYD